MILEAKGQLGGIRMKSDDRGTPNVGGVLLLHQTELCIYISKETPQESDGKQSL